LLQLVPAVQTPGVTLFSTQRALPFHVPSDRARESAKRGVSINERESFQNSSARIDSTCRMPRDRDSTAGSCRPMVEQICSNAAEIQLHEGTLMVGYSSQPEEARVVPFVVLVFRKDGSRATEVDCYANTDFHTYCIVRSDLAIPPTFQESVNFLRDRHQHLSAYPGSFAKVDHPCVQMASGSSASSLSSR
jgi:hypothetical protein